MKKSFLLILIGILISGVILTSCDPTGPKPDDTVVEVNNNITEPTVWAGDKVYVINKFDFFVEDVLTIEAGAVIKFPASYKFLTISGNGKIIANGTSSSPIVFTSHKDDSNGGDTNGDGGSTVAAVGDWGNIDINGTTGSQFTHCKFLYGGFGTSPTATLNLPSGSKATIQNCTFAFNGGGKSGNYYVGALNADNASNETVIQNNTFYSNTLPLAINAEISIDNSNSFSFNGSSNTFNAIYVSRNIEQNTSWLEDEVAFVITSDNMSVAIGKVLTLGENVVLKFVEGATLTLLSGESALANYDGTGVYYTSLKDDELKGDSNGDGNSSSPNIADWTGVFLDNWKSTGYAQWSNIRYNDPNPSAKK